MRRGEIKEPREVEDVRPRERNRGPKNNKNIHVNQRGERLRENFQKAKLLDIHITRGINIEIEQAKDLIKL